MQGNEGRRPGQDLGLSLSLLSEYSGGGVYVSGQDTEG